MGLRLTSRCPRWKSGARARASIPRDTTFCPVRNHGSVSSSLVKHSYKEITVHMQGDKKSFKEGSTFEDIQLADALLEDDDVIAFFNAMKVEATEGDCLTALRLLRPERIVATVYDNGEDEADADEANRQPNADELGDGALANVADVGDCAAA